MGNDGGYRLGRRAAVAIGVVAVLMIAGLGWTILRDETPSVGSGSGGPGEYAQVLRLDQGRAGHVSVETSDHVEVWWRGPGETGWSASQVIDGGFHRYLTATKIGVAGSTVAIRAFYNPEPPWEDEPGEPGLATSVFIVCQPGSCLVSDHYERVQEPPCQRGSCLLRQPRNTGVSRVPELSTDGGLVFFGSTENGHVVWSPEDGIQELEPEGLPSDGALGTPMMAPDGSFRVVSGRDEDGTCHLTLLTSAPPTDSAATVAYTEQATTSTPTSTGDCGTALEAFTGEHLLVHTDRAEPVYLVRDGDSWKRPPPTQPACCATVNSPGGTPPGV